MSITFTSTIPILRIFDVNKANEFYVGFLGFKIDWTHRFDDNSPLYQQVSRSGLILHLSEHHGDCTPGAQVRIMTKGIEDLHKELIEKNYMYMKPGLEDGISGGHEILVIDPFGNQIRFCQDEAA